MYTPPFSHLDVDAAFDLLDVAPLGHLVSVGLDGLEATALPLLADRVVPRLRGHVARGNHHWRSLHGANVLVVLVAASGYVSPAWYPSKADDARVVPTRNYEVVTIIMSPQRWSRVDQANRHVTALDGRVASEGSSDERDAIGCRRSSARAVALAIR